MKPESERQLPYSFTHLCNINKQRKQTVKCKKISFRLGKNKAAIREANFSEREVKKGKGM